MDIYIYIYIFFSLYFVSTASTYQKRECLIQTGSNKDLKTEHVFQNSLRSKQGRLL